MYVLHPGKIRSSSDGDVHHIGVSQLVKLYRLPPGSWRTAHVADLERCLTSGDDCHLYPLDSGEYDRIADDLEQMRRTQPTTNETRG